MQPVDTFDIQMRQLQAMVIRRRVLRGVVVFLSAALGFNAGLVAMARAGWLQGADIWGLVSLSVALIGALVWDGYRQITLRDTLAVLDGHWDLKELLATAFECHRRGDRSVFAAKLMDQAGDYMAAIGRRRWLPGNLLRRYGVLSAMASMFLLVLVLPGVTVKLGDGEQTGRAAAAARQVRAYVAQARRSAAEQAHRPGAVQASRSLDFLGEQLRAYDQAAISPEKFLRSLGAYYDQLEGERRRRLQQLIDEVFLGDASRVPDLASSPAEPSASGRPDRLQEQLSDRFGGRMPQSLSQSLARLRQIQELVRMLRQVLDKAGPGEFAGDMVPLMKTEAAPAAGAADQITSLPAATPGRISPAVTTRDPADLTPSGGSAVPTGGRDTDGSQNDSGGRSAAGRFGSDDTRQPPSALSAGRGEILRDRGLKTTQVHYNRYVLALPVINQSRRAPQEVVRTYSREVEEALHKEEIPEAFKDNIKTYFLSIDLSRPENK